MIELTRDESRLLESLVEAEAERDEWALQRGLSLAFPMRESVRTRVEARVATYRAILAKLRRAARA